MKALKIALTAALFAVGASAAIAQTTAPAPAPKAPAATTAPTTAPATTAAPSKGAKKPQSAESKACSDKADAQNPHGKPRKDFRKKCMQEAKAAAKKP